MADQHNEFVLVYPDEKQRGRLKAAFRICLTCKLAPNTSAYLDGTRVAAIQMVPKYTADEAHRAGWTMITTSDRTAWVCPECSSKFYEMLDRGKL